MKSVTISEYGYIGCDGISTFGAKFSGKRDLKPEDFNELYDFWLSDKETQKVFTFENKQCLKATSYVGVIQTKSLSIEILPKIYKNLDGTEHTKGTYRGVFIEMLKPLLNINEIQINKANLSTTKNKNIYEIFIAMFIEHMDNLIHRGLKSQYIAREDNQYFLKGKLKFNEHIKKNYVHKERFYVEFDEYLQDRVENRLLKSVIVLLLKKTNNYENKRALRQQLFVFDEVSLSTAYDVDFKKVNLHRGMEYYALPMRFAEVFLKHQSFTSMQGKDNVFALLFPMETVFEKYVEFLLKNSDLEIKNIHINGIKKNEHFLSHEQVRLEPDYLLEKNDGEYIVTDAKWKLYDDELTSKLSSGDVYQLFSYLTYYNASDTAYVFIPKMNNSDNDTCFTYKNSHCDLKQQIKLVPIDLLSVTGTHKVDNFLIEGDKCQN